MNVVFNPNNKAAFGNGDCRKAVKIMKRYGVPPLAIAKKMKLEAPINGKTIDKFHISREKLAFDFADALSRHANTICENVKKVFS